MELLERYEVILNQALKELGPIELPKDSQKAFQVQAVLAPVLGDILYRLTVEHGVAFTPFRESVISLIADRKPALAPSGAPAPAPRGFAAALEASHPLILLALEMMPPDEPF